MIKQDILENQVKIVYLAIGSNLGNKKQTITKAKFELLKSGILIEKSSSYYESLSWPNPKKPKFINVVLKINTKMSAISLLKLCQNIEVELGRKRSIKNEPRTCDIDIIDYDQKNFKVNNSVNLSLPHPRLSKRNFVLLPLFEISQNWQHPKSKINIGKLINKLDIDDLRAIKQF